jgi:hypothetical protein
VSRPIPNHGTEARYQGTVNRPACRCRRCIDGWTKAGKKRQLAALQGRPASIPAAPVTTHLLKLHASGMSNGQIAAASGVNSSTIRDHARGAFPTIRRTTAEKILAVRTDQPLTIGHVPALASTRRCRALYAAGHAPATIAAAHPRLLLRSVEYIVQGARSVVSAANHNAIAEVYQTLATAQGTSDRARARAAVEGWAGPGYWDDEDFDNPHFVPALKVTARQAEIVAENAAWLIEDGLHPDIAAKWLGKSRFYIDRALREARAAQVDQLETAA